MAGMPTELYRPSLALLTDLYQLTMAYGYWKLGMADREAVFHLHFRRPPFGGGFCVAAGIEAAAELCQALRFEPQDLAYLETLRGNDGAPLFEPAFLDHLAALRFDGELWGLPEGCPVFAQEPLLRVQAGILLCQLLETPLLNVVNFQTLIATKAARVCAAAAGQPVVDFGLRRAQGVDGALAASYAAYLGGVAASSNVLAGRLFGLPVKGTHAHSWVMAFPTERSAFEAYAAVMPNNCIFLVDTYDTLTGLRTAAEVGVALRERGHRLSGVRLDSGDLVELSQAARRILDEAGLGDAQVVASNDLDEYEILRLKEAGAAIDVWGVGTRLVTAWDQPALGGVYKLSALREGPLEPWRYVLKLSEQPVKVSTPGRMQVRRYSRGGQAVADLIYELDTPPAGPPPHAAPLDALGERVALDLGDCEPEDLLRPLLVAGRAQGSRPGLAQARDDSAARLHGLPAGLRRLREPDPYPVLLDPALAELKLRCLAEARRR